MLEPKIFQRVDTRKDGTALLCIQLVFSGKPYRINLGISVRKDQFDSLTGRVKRNHPNSSDFNLIIQQGMARVTETLVRFRLSREPLTLESFKRAYHNESAIEDFLSFWEQEMYEQFQRGQFTEGTLKRHQRCFERLQRFTQEELSQERLLFYQISPSLMAKFDLWLAKLLKKRGAVDGKPERRNCQKSIKKFLLSAKRLGKEFQDPFPPGSNVKFKTPERTWLSEQELGRMYDLFKKRDKNIFIDKSIRIVLRSYLVQCFSGLRFSDVRATKIQARQKDYIKILPQKTEKYAEWLRVPLSEPLRNLLKGKDIQEDRLFVQRFHKVEYVPLVPTLTEPATNRILKDLAKMAHIQKKITTHSGRHTFATLFLERGGSIEVLQKLLGHRNIRSTMTYVHVWRQQKVKR
ncbi:MAG: site-specific integrase [Bacteroidia bacterium]|nr:site-specific integrase [Bacteroidia bacterium]